MIRLLLIGGSRDGRFTDLMPGARHVVFRDPREEYRAEAIKFPGDRTIDYLVISTMSHADAFQQLLDRYALPMRLGLSNPSR